MVTELGDGHGNRATGAPSRSRRSGGLDRVGRGYRFDVVEYTTVPDPDPDYDGGNGFYCAPVDHASRSACGGNWRRNWLRRTIERHARADATMSGKGTCWDKAVMRLLNWVSVQT